MIDAILTEISSRPRPASLCRIVLVVVLGLGGNAAAQELGRKIRIFDDTPKTIVVNGYSTSFEWPELLQDRLDKMYAGKRVLTVKPATKGGTPIARWMDIETGEPLKPWLDILRPAIRDANDRVVIVLAQQSLQWCFGPPEAGIRDANDVERIKKGADVLEKYVRLLKEDDADLVFVAMHIYKHPMEPEIGNERLALAELIKRKIPGVKAGPDVWTPTKEKYPDAFAADKLHPNDEGARIMAQKWFDTLLEHDGVDPEVWNRRLARRPGETSARYQERLNRQRKEIRRGVGIWFEKIRKGDGGDPILWDRPPARRPGETTAAYTKRIANERAKQQSTTQTQADQTVLKSLPPRMPGETTAAYTKRIANERAKQQADRQRRDQATATAHKNVEYVPGGHQRQKLDIFLPTEPGEKPLPLIIWIHGGAWLAGSKENCPAKRFVQRGYAVASINYRLSQHAIFPAQVEDCKAAVRFLRANSAEYGFDPNRFGVWGASAGGHLVALLGTTGDVKEFEKGQNLDVSSSVQAVCDYFGPTDFSKMSSFWSTMDHDAPDSPEAKLIGGPVQQNKDKCKRANPITYATKDDPPFVIVHGDKDPLVPHNQSEILRQALQKAGVKAEFHTVAGGGHGGFKDPGLDKMVEEFFDKNLKSAQKTR